MMLAEGDDEAARNAGPFVPERDAITEARRIHDFWQQARSLRPNECRMATYRRAKDGATIVVIPAGDAELGAGDRFRPRMPPVVVRTDCPAHLIRLPQGVPLQPNMVLRDPYPAYRVTLPAYAIDVTEVTWQQYAAYQRQVLHRSKPRPAEWAAPDHPVTDVTWYEAAGYCDWVGGRLPTDAEWEHAARGPESFAWPWGDEWPPPADGANVYDASLAEAFCEPNPRLLDDGFIYSAPVGTFPKGASPYGVLDLIGNASEWVADWSDDCDRVVKPVARPCPPGKKTIRYKVERGESFFSHELLWRPTGQAWTRGGGPPWSRDPARGFRCAHDLDDTSAALPTER